MTIDQSTKIPLLTAMGFLPIFIGGIIWLTSIDAKATTAATATAISQQDLREMKALVIDVRERLIKMETKLQK